MKYIHLAIAVILPHLSYVVANAQEINWYAEGLKAQKQGDIPSAITSFKKAANTGLSDAKFALGCLYRDKLGNFELSFKNFEQAANQGNKYAQYELGVAYLTGTPYLLRDSVKAKKWFLKAASRRNYGDPAYQLFLLASNDSEATQWLQIAAEQGVIEAMRVLSDAYRNGRYGLNVNEKIANMWMDRLTQTMEADSE